MYFDKQRLIDLVEHHGSVSIVDLACWLSEDNEDRQRTQQRIRQLLADAPGIEKTPTGYRSVAVTTKS